eukprot:7389-Heterococcus_DN1.PRE.2
MVVAQSDAASFNRSVILRPYEHDGTHSAKSWGNVQFPMDRRFTKKINPATPATLPSARKVLQQLYLADESPGSPVKLSQEYHLKSPHCTYCMNMRALKHHFVATMPVLVPQQIPCDDGVVDDLCPAQCAAAGGKADQTIPYTRAKAQLVSGVRTPLNAATPYHDLDNIYGRSDKAAQQLRGEGALMNLTADGLPHSVLGADGVSREWLIADQRSAQHPGTLALHTLLLREHNRRVAEFTPQYLQQLEAQYGCQPKPCTQWNDDDIYNAARMFTISVAQHITLHEFGPLVLGLNSTQEGTPNHDPSTTPAVDVFVALALSYAHSAFGPIDRLLDADWLPLTSGDQTPVTSAAVCTHAYQQQLLATANGGLDAIIRGMVLADGAAVDAFMPRETGSNACSAQPLLTIQAGRDYLVPSYNVMRAALNLTVAKTWSDITSNTVAAAALKALYKDIDTVDAVVGGLAEDTEPNNVIGPLFNYASTVSTQHAIYSMEIVPRLAAVEHFKAALSDQLMRMKKGDILWHDHAPELHELAASNASDVTVLPVHVYRAVQNIITDSRDSSFGHLAARNMVQVAAKSTPTTTALAAATAAPAVANTTSASTALHCYVQDALPFEVVAAAHWPQLRVRAAACMPSFSATAKLLHTEPPVFPVEGFKAERYSIATTTTAELNQKLVMIPVSSTTATTVTTDSTYTLKLFSLSTGAALTGTVPPRHLYYLASCSDVYEISWRIDQVVGNITFTAKFTGMGDNGYFAFGLGQKMAGADIFAFIAYELVIKPGFSFVCDDAVHRAAQTGRKAYYNRQ